MGQEDREGPRVRSWGSCALLAGLLDLVADAAHRLRAERGIIAELDGLDVNEMCPGPPERTWASTC